MLGGWGEGGSMFLAWVIIENIGRGLVGRNELVLLRCLCSIHVIIGARHVN